MFAFRTSSGFCNFDMKTTDSLPKDNMASSSAAVGTSLPTHLKNMTTRSIAQKCAEVETVIQSTGSKELRNTLPMLLEHIFGLESEPGWGLDMLCRSVNTQDFDAVRKLLAPEGPLLTQITNLQADQYLTYEFPVNYLPAPTRNIIDEGGIPLFYANKLQYQNYGRPTVILNAFECYMFHFVYCLVSPAWQKRNPTWNTLTDCLYPCLLDDYLSYFLPLYKNSLPPVPHNLSPVRSPMAHSIIGGKSPNSNTPPKTRSRLGLLKSSFTTTPKQHPQGSPVFGQNEAETWRSETLLQTLSEFWLNQNPVETERQVLTSHPMSMSTPTQRVRRGPFDYLYEHFMPSKNHTRLVRMLIKHVHNFVNTAPQEIMTSSYQSHLVSPLDEFKKNVIPQIIQKKLYAFLRHGFDRWPLDSSFRLMLETWLTYVQPWRYIPSTSKRARTRRDSDPETKAVEEGRWYTFVEDNLLFYTVLFQEFIGRVYRMDLTAPINGLMLFRVSKVFSLPNLCTLIRRAERDLCASLFRSFRVSPVHDLGGSYLSQETNLSLHTQLSELERSGFQYPPLFEGDQALPAVNEVIKQICEAKTTISNMELSRSKPSKSGFSSLFDMSSWFEDQNSSFGDLSMAEVKKLHGYLDMSVKGLCTVFEIPPADYIAHGVCTSPGMYAHNSTLGHTSLLDDMDETSTPDYGETDDGIKLTPLGRSQMMNRLKKFDIGYQGDPAMQPIRSFENATLVRLLYHFCLFVNTQFNDEIMRLYYRDGLIGRMAQVYFSPPLTPEKKVNSPMSPVVRQELEKPRLNLRFLANYRNLMYLGIIYLFLRFLFGLSPMGYVLFLLICFLVIGFLRALAQPRQMAHS